MKEFYWNQDRSLLLCEDLNTGNVTKFTDLKRSFVIEADRKIKSLFPETYIELSEWIGSGPGKEYGRVYQFCACNFSTKDGRADIDDDFNFIPETVSCPIRHYCKRNICRLVYTSELSEREKEIVVLISRHTEEEVSILLFISPATVHNHVTRIYTKLGISGPEAMKELIHYAYKSKLIK